MKQLQGLVSHIQRFAVHDGPGIRTLIFMKGCPLKCLWCSSPQTQNPFPEILHDAAQCQKCGDCVDACLPGAMTLSEEEVVRIDRELCTSCGQCVEACPNQALELVGNHVIVEELLQEIAKDTPFYRRSEGGITVGGGEPTMQHEFVTEFLSRVKQQFIHTVIETCGYVRWEHLENLLGYVDLVYFDIKHMDAVIHKRLTGISNELILENVRMTSSAHPTIIRIPVVPGSNDSDDNILATARFASGLGENLVRVELLPYHGLGSQTYRRLRRKYQLEDVEPPRDGHMERLRGIVEACGVRARVGG